MQKIITTIKGIINNPHVQLVDVRNQEEYKTGHLPGAQNIPLHFTAAVAAAYTTFNFT